MVRQGFDKDAVIKALKCSLKEALNTQMLQEKLSHGGSQQQVGLVARGGSKFDRINCPCKSVLRSVQPVTVGKNKQQTEQPPKTPKLLYKRHKSQLIVLI